MDWDTIVSIMVIPIAALLLISLQAFRHKKKIRGLFALGPIGPIILIGIIAIFTLTTPPIETEIAGSADLQFTPSSYVEEFIVPTPNSRPQAIAVDDVGKVWFVMNGLGKLGVFDPENGKFEEFNIPGVDQAESWRLEIDENGDLWFPDAVSNNIWQFNPELNSFSSFRVPTLDAFPVQLTVDHTGDIWFTELTGNNVAKLSIPESRLATSRGITEFPSITQKSGPAGLVIDNEEKVWFTQTYTDDKIGVLDIESGEIIEYRLPKPIASPYGIVLDSGGNSWITEHGGNRIVKFNPNDLTMIEYETTPTENYPITLPENIVIDNQDKIWFNEHAGNRIGTIDPSTGMLTEYVVPTGPLVNVLDLAIAPDGQIWFTELTSGKIGVVKTEVEPSFTIKVNSKSIETTRNSQFTVNLEIESAEAIELEATSSAFKLHGGRVGLKTNDLPMTYTPNSDREIIPITFETTEAIGASTYSITIKASNNEIIESIFVTLIVKPS